MIVRIKSFLKRPNFFVLGLIVLLGSPFVVDMLIPYQYDADKNNYARMVCNIVALVFYTIYMGKCITKQSRLWDKVPIKWKRIIIIVIIASFLLGTISGILIVLNPHWLP